MSADKQRIAIAEACGIKVVEAQDGWFDLVTNGIPWEEDKGTYRDEVVAQLPDYLSDLNAMHEAEMKLDKDQLWEFASKLSVVMDNAPRRFKGMAWEAHQVSPTAAQRAEAFLRTIGKWEESHE